jgi:hypothetical protein
MSNIHRKIWEQNFGKIPKDKNGRTYEIHHIDGNHNNNNLENLICVSIEDHYKIHYENKDYGACVMIAKRMELPPEYISNIQKGVKRPGIGGVKKGTIPWNKGKKGYKLNLTEEGKLNMIQSAKKSAKIKEEQVEIILKDYKNSIHINDERIGKIRGNGKVFTYKRAFCESMAKQYDVTIQAIERLLRINVQKK